MSRWEPDAGGRLGRAALDLYSERGFEQTTVQDIAERAGVTERTFFRYFADKREVLFDGSHALEEAIVDAVTAAPPAASDAPLRLVVDAIRTTAAFFDGIRPYSTQRAQVIGANPSLQERELLKFASMAAGIAAALRARGIPDAEADLAADAGIVVFHRGFQRWIGGDGDKDYGRCLQETFDDLTAMASEPRVGA